jgi:preprotein translocase subunit YajC
MSLSILPVLAAAAAPDGPPQWLTLLPYLALPVIFWFLLLRPQQQQQKAQKAKLAAIKKGDQVLTGGGLIAKVVKVEDDYLDLDLGPNVRVRALKSTITDIIPPAGAKPAND